MIHQLMATFYGWKFNCTVLSDGEKSKMRGSGLLTLPDEARKKVWQPGLNTKNDFVAPPRHKTYIRNDLFTVKEEKK